ncbi:hypothetical protein GMSM_26520 [Geomonas sp. Red276]
MNAIVFDQVRGGEVLEEVTLSVPKGSRAAVISSRQEDCDLLLRLMLGLAAPDSGTVTVLGQEVATLSEKALNLFRREVAVVQSSGGLVSNLKVWENLVLPLEYHSKLSSADIEERGAAALQEVGYTGRLMELPAHLSVYQKRQIGLARAILTDPPLAVYQGIFSGLSGSERNSLVAAINRFNKGNPERTALFLATDEAALKDLDINLRISVKGSSAHD